MRRCGAGCGNAVFDRKLAIAVQKRSVKLLAEQKANCGVRRNNWCGKELAAIESGVDRLKPAAPEKHKPALVPVREGFKRKRRFGRTATKR